MQPIERTYDERRIAAMADRMEEARERIEALERALLQAQAERDEARENVYTLADERAMALAQRDAARAALNEKEAR